MNKKQVAETILSQMGGYNRLSAMIGAKHLFQVEEGGKCGLSFRFGGSKVHNYCRVLLNGNDLYDVHISRVVKARGEFRYEYKNVAEYTDIFADQLMDLFEETTNLYLTFSPRN